MRHLRNSARIFTIMLLFLFAACESPNDSNYDPPTSHTLNKDGFMHKPGLDSPLTNCSDCHGSDLRGGSTGVSCYECHGKKW